MGYYNSLKTLKTAAIGTIMPWAGDTASSKTGYENQGDFGVPRGWIVCNGSSYSANELPLLAQTIGTTYGGTITGSFPDYNPLDSFLVPNLTGKHMADYSTSYITGVTGLPSSDSEAQTAITSKMGANTDSGISNSYTSNANLTFSITASNTMVGKTTGQTADDPTYFKLYYTVSRKLGQRHTPGHDHGNAYPSIQGTGVLAELYETPTPNTEGNGKRVTGYRGNNQAETGSPDTQGSLRFSVFEDNTESHIVTDQPRSFGANTICSHPFSGGYIPLKSDKYPYTRNQTGQYKNFSSNLPHPNFGFDSNVTYATTFNHNYDQWGNNALPGGHNHGVFDITMNKSGLKPPKTIYHNDVSTHNVTPQNVPNAVSMTVDVNTPSMNMLYIIKAF